MARLSRQSGRSARLVSEQLREAIRRDGRSLCQIAAASGTNDGQLSRFCRNERGLTTDTVDRLCAFLGLELRESKRKGR